MNFNIEILNLPAGFESLKLPELCEFVLNKEFPYGDFKSIDVSISFVNKDEIHLLNKEYRSIDNPTDVLSFEIDGFDLHEGARNPSLNLDDWLVGINDDVSEVAPDTAESFQLGDIIICSEVAKENCEKFNTSIENEIKLLITHGLLHLCGYDHINDDDAEAMESVEDNLLNEWGSRV